MSDRLTKALANALLLFLLLVGVKRLLKIGNTSLALSGQC